MSNRTVIRSESKGSKIWDSLQANNPYQSSSTSVDLLGIWPDKLLAAQMLVRRDTPSIATEHSNLALIDLDGRASELYANIYGLANVPDPRETKKVTFVDKDGNDVSTVEEYTTPVDQMIEATPSYLWPMKRYFGIGGDEAFNYWTEGSWQDTRVPYLAALLKNISKYGRQSQYGLSDTAAGLRDGIHLTYADRRYDDDDRSITYTRKGRKYHISYRNFVGQRLADASLYRSDQAARVTKLDDDGSSTTALPVRTLLHPITRAEGRGDSRIREVRLITLRDIDLYDELTRISKITNFLTKSRALDQAFVRYDADDNVTTKSSATVCRRFNKAGEDEADRKARVCHKESRVGVLLRSFNNIDSDRFDALREHADRLTNNYNATINGGRIDRWNPYSESYSPYFRNYAARPELTEIFSYPADELISWYDGDYKDYRKILEQFPVYAD